jgi:hypothetical protein
MARSVVIFITLLHQYYLIYEPQIDDRLKTLAFCGLEIWFFQNLDRLCSLESLLSSKGDFKCLESI